MIDLDRLDEQLELALTDELRLLRGTATTVAPAPEPPPAPVAPLEPRYVAPAPTARAAAPAAAPAPPLAAPTPPPAPARPRCVAPQPIPRPAAVDLEVPVAELVARGHFDDAEAAMEATGVPVAWKIMRAIFEGRRDEARSAVTSVRRLASENDERYWTQRFWVALEWGDSKERFEVLDHCRERAYRYDELRWRGALTLQLARMGRMDEAARELATTLSCLDARRTDDTARDVATNLVEAAAILGDAPAAATVAGWLRGGGLVVVGDAWVCKGAMARFQALAASTHGNWKTVDQSFQVAVDTHRTLGAGPLLARTLAEWSATLAGRDPARAHRLLNEAVTLADSLRLTGLTTHQQALAG